MDPLVANSTWLLSLIGLPGGHPATDLGRSNCVRGNLERFQVAVEHHYADNGTYPLSMSQLRDLDYLPVLPQNPFASKLYRLGYAAGGDKHAESYIGMHPIGESTGPVDGKFAYLPQLAENEEGNLFISGYKLVGFGRERYPGMNESLSCEIIVLSSSEPYCIDSRDSGT